MALSGAYEEAILALLAARREGATICPSEAARAVAGDDGFRDAMDDVRAVAATMADRGALEVTQRGVIVDVRAACGPVRLRLPR